MTDNPNQVDAGIEAAYDALADEFSSIAESYGISAMSETSFQFALDRLWEAIASAWEQSER